METINTNSRPMQSNLVTNSNSLNPKVILSICLDKWKWFVLSILIVMGLAMLYLLCTPSVYIRSASLLIKENSNGQSSSSNVSSMFSDMGFDNVNTNVNNELITIQSPTIIAETVKRLNLNIDYFAKGLFHNQTIYGSDLPVKVSFFNLDDNKTLTAELQIKKDDHIQLSISDHAELDDKKFEGKLNDSISIGIGKVVVSPTIYYDKKKNYPTYYIKRSSIQSSIENCKKNFSAILNSEGTTVIDLFYQDVSPQRAEDILNTIITIYNENWLKDKNQITVSTSQFINERLGVIEQELGDVDEDISSFKSTHLLPDVDAASNLYMNQSQANSNQLLDLNTQLSMARQIRNHVASVAGKNQLLPANSGLGSSGIEQQISEYNNAQLQRNNLVSNSSDQNPLVLDMDQTLGSMRRAILSSIDNLISSLQTQIASLRHNEQQTTTQIAAAPNQTKYLQAVGRQQKVKEELYLFLLQKREENELSQAFTAYNTRLITPPNGNHIPVAPQKGKILLMAFVVGLVIPLGIIVLKEGTNTTIRGRKDLVGLSLPFLGEIPLCLTNKERKIGKKFGSHHKSSDHEAGMVVVKAGNRNMANEAFRVLRTNIEFISNKDKLKNVYLFTSFNPGSGKTFITMNTAVSFAIKGKKVLLIDGDLRRASASAYFNKPKYGLSDYLAGTIENIQDVLISGTTLIANVSETDRNLYVNITALPVGTIPPNPTELLFDGRFESLLSTLRNQYDYIFIDCPPIDIMADTQIIEKMADRTIFIVRAGLLERNMLPELERTYQEKRFKEMALILNGTESSGQYGYRYGYKYGYKYGYREYSDNKA